ncbi:MAG: hypothetical protein LBS82_01200 [Spirochaetaceae bacterium]|nr:hypothetical protein [Spirochaetaceae bacterium]
MMMMKKAMLLTAVMATAGQAMYALDISFGGGFLAGATANKMQTEEKSFSGSLYNPTNPSSPTSVSGDMSLGYTVNDTDVGFFVFADCTYAELSFGYLEQNGTVSNTKLKTTDPTADQGLAMLQVTPIKNVPYKSTLLLIDAIGKYPVAFGDKVSLFPALGLSARFAVAGNDYSDYKHDANWGIGLKLGGGMDLNVSEKVYIRGQFLCYFELGADKDIKIDEMAPILGMLGTDTTFKVKSEGYYIQPQVKLAVGYKL